MPSPSLPSVASPAGVIEPRAEPSIYGRAFWLAYLANVLLVCANSLTFRFAEFVRELGGTETNSGEIVRAGLIAAMVSRFWLGGAIDRHGAGRVWIASGVLYVIGALAILSCTQLSPLIWCARIAYTVGLAGMFSCSMVHIQAQAPPHRRTELIGSLGSSGFIGTIVGTQLNDLLFNSMVRAAGSGALVPSPFRFTWLFGGAAVLGGLHMLVVYLLTRGENHRAPARTPAAHHLLFQHWPGLILLVAATMGSGFVVTTVFLTRFATATHLQGISTFFLAYSVTAFSCRWIFRGFSQQAGRHRMVLYGLFGMAIGQWLFMAVKNDWQFLFPAVASGFGHALLFPAVVSLGAGRFPVQYRGTGTTLVLGFTELGTAIAAPLQGQLIDMGNARAPGLGFTWMFLAAGIAALLTGLIYAATAARVPDADPTFPLIADLDGMGEECADTTEDLENDADDGRNLSKAEPASS